MNNELNFGRREEEDFDLDLTKIENLEWRMSMRDYIENLTNKSDLKEELHKYNYLKVNSTDKADKEMYAMVCCAIKREMKRRNIELKEND